MGKKGSRPNLASILAIRKLDPGTHSFQWHRKCDRELRGIIRRLIIIGTSPCLGRCRFCLLLVRAVLQRLDELVRWVSFSVGLVSPWNEHVAQLLYLLTFSFGVES